MGRHSVQAEQVVGGSHEAPLGAGSGSAASVESDKAAVVLGVAEDGFDQLGASFVELAAALGGEGGAHEVVSAAGPARSLGLVDAPAGIGRYPHRDAVAGDLVHLLQMPVPRVGDDHVQRMGDTGGTQLAACGGDHRSEVSEVR